MSSAEQPSTSNTPTEPPRSPGRRAIRWVAPVAAAALAVGGGLVANTAAADPTLPKKSPEQLVKAVAGAQPDGLSGTVSETANLGLPALPGLQEQGSHGHGKSSADFSALLSGTHTLKVWSAGDDKSRIALLGENGESDAIRNGHEGWLWSSSDKSATHLKFPRNSASGTKKSPTGGPSGMPATPQRAAEYALDQIGPTTKMSVARDVTVAGRSAYQLMLKPQDSHSLVSQVRIAVDAKTSTPLRVQVRAQGQEKPAFSVGFRSVDFSVPKAKRFHFNPPSSAKVTQRKAFDKSAADSKRMAKASKTVGSGWSKVQITDLTKAADGKHGSARPRSGTANKDLRQALSSLPKVSGSWGSGHLLRGSLFSAVLTDKGQLAVGATKPSVLYRALDS